MKAAHNVEIFLTKGKGAMRMGCVCFSRDTVLMIWFPRTVNVTMPYFRLRVKADVGIN